MNRHMAAALRLNSFPGEMEGWGDGREEQSGRSAEGATCDGGRTARWLDLACAPGRGQRLVDPPQRPGGFDRLKRENLQRR